MWIIFLLLRFFFCCSTWNQQVNLCVLFFSSQWFLIFLIPYLIFFIIIPLGYIISLHCSLQLNHDRCWEWIHLNIFDFAASYFRSAFRSLQEMKMINPAKVIFSIYFVFYWLSLHSHRELNFLTIYSLLTPHLQWSNGVIDDLHSLFKSFWCVLRALLVKKCNFHRIFPFNCPSNLFFQSLFTILSCNIRSLMHLLSVRCLFELWMVMVWLS